MKKTLLLSISLLAFSLFGYGQNIPNDDYEKWENRTYYEIPTYDFPHFHTNIYAGGFNGATPNIIRVKGVGAKSSAIRLETRADSTNGILLLGGVIGDSIIGGFPFSEDIYKLNIKARYDIKATDTASVIMILRANGKSFFTYSEEITGTESDFIDITASLDKALTTTPDTCVIAIFSSNTEDSLVVPGSYIEIDEIWFNRVSDSARVDIPNGSFENWEDEAFYEPQGWNTSNLYALDSNNVTKTTNSLDNSSAVLIESQALSFEDTNGILFAGLIGENGVEKPAFPISSAPTKITIDYQYTPASSTDTAVIYLSFSKYNPITKSRITTGVSRAKLVANSTMETVDVPFVISGPVDSVAVTIASSIDEKSNSHKPQEGSKLIVDNLKVETVTGTFDLFNANASMIYPNPATNNISITEDRVSSINVLNNLGQHVLNTNVSNQSVDFNLEAGSYILQLLDENQQLIKTEKLIIK